MAIKQLAGLAQHGEPDATQVAACVHLLNRGWGMPIQPVEGKVDANIEIVIRNIIRGEPKVIEASYTKKDNGDGQS